MTVLFGADTPAIFLRAVITYRLHVTVAETGLPGRPKKNFFRSSNSAVAKVVGFLCEKNTILSFFLHRVVTK